MNSFITVAPYENRKKDFGTYECKVLFVVNTCSSWLSPVNPDILKNNMSTKAKDSSLQKGGGNMMYKVRRAGILGTGRYVPDLCPTSSRRSVQKTHRKAVRGKLKEVLYFIWAKP